MKRNDEKKELAARKLVAWLTTILACAYLVYKLCAYDQWEQLGASLAEADAVAWTCGVVALLLMPLNMLLEAWRWQFLMGNLSLREAQRQVYFSKLAGQLTPYQVGEYPARGLLIRDTPWSEVISKGIVGSVTMTLAIILVGIVPLLIWLGDGRWQTDWVLYGLILLSVIQLALLLPRLLRRWIELNYRMLFVSVGQSLLRYMCWCVQFALVLCLFGMAPMAEWLVLIPVYYLLVTVAPTVSVAEAGVRGAVAIFVFGSVEAVLAGVLLWAINSLLPILVGSFVDKNAKIFGNLKKNA